MRTNHQLARLQARSFGSIAVFGNSPEGGIFSKINTFGGVPRAIKARRARSTRSSSLVSRGDSLSDNYITPGAQSYSQNYSQSSIPASIPASYDLFDADNPLTGGESDSSLGAAPVAYFGSDPAMVRREGGIMTSITSFGEAGDEPQAAHPSHMPYFGSGFGTALGVLGAGYLILKLKGRI